MKRIIFISLLLSSYANAYPNIPRDEQYCKFLSQQIGQTQRASYPKENEEFRQARIRQLQNAYQIYCQ